MSKLHITFKRNIKWHVTAHSCIEADTFNVKVNGDWLYDEDGNVAEYYTKDKAYAAILGHWWDDVKVRYE